MGHCISIASSVQDSNHGQEDNVVYYSENNERNDGDQKIGSIYSQTGGKGLNQDAAILYEDYGIEGGVFCGVFDGHGNNGHIVSKMVRDRLPPLVLDQRIDLGKITTCSIDSSNIDGEIVPKKNCIKWKEACTNAFNIMEKKLKSLEKLDCSCSGAAAVVVIRQGDDLIIANLGDSRAIIGKKTEDGIRAVKLTTDLKPSLPSEAERIKKSHGRVFSLREEPYMQRVWLPHDDSPGLAMSRSLGDFILKNYGLISTPEVSYYHLSAQDLFLVMATDGVWDVLSNNEVATIVYSTEKEEEAAKAVVSWSTAAWKHKFPTLRRDDCTALCLFLQNRHQINLPPNS